MKAVFQCEPSGITVAFDMELRPEAFFAGSGLHPGYALAEPPEDHAAIQFYQSYDLEEYLLQAMYEGGQFCGTFWDQEPDVGFHWALMPEQPEEQQHIENVVLMYGRAAKLESLKIPGAVGPRGGFETSLPAIKKAPLPNEVCDDP